MEKKEQAIKSNFMLDPPVFICW